MSIKSIIDPQLDRGTDTGQIPQWNNTTKRFEPTSSVDGITLGTPWALAGDGSWTGSSILDISDTSKLIQFNSSGLLLFRDDTELSWLELDASGNSIQFGDVTSDIAFKFQGTGLTTFGGNTKTQGGRIVNTTRVTTSPYTVLTTDHHIFVDTDGGAITLNLPAGVDGQTYRIINTGSATNAVTITPNGTEKLFGANASDTISDSESITITYETTEGWW